VQQQLPPGDRYLCLTRKQCDCGTVLGCLREEPGVDAKRLEAKCQQLRARGWSEAKIARWRLDKQQGGERVARQADEGRRNRLEEAEQWLDFLRALLAVPGATRAGLLLHWYRGGPAEERLQIQRRQSVRLDEATPELLMRIDEDVLYEF